MQPRTLWKWRLALMVSEICIISAVPTIFSLPGKCLGAVFYSINGVGNGLCSNILYNALFSPESDILGGIIQLVIFSVFFFCPALVGIAVIRGSWTDINQGVPVRKWIWRGANITGVYYVFLSLYLIISKITSLEIPIMAICMLVTALAYSSLPLEACTDQTAFLQQSLGPGQKLVFSYRPSKGSKRELYYGLLGIGAIVLVIEVIGLSSTLSAISPVLYLICLLGLIIIFFRGMLGWVFYWLQIVRRHRLYAFTDTSLMAIYPPGFAFPQRVILVKYTNITAITMQQFDGTTYTIEIQLSSTLANYPHRYFYISAIPKTSKIFDQIKELVEKSPSL